MQAYSKKREVSAQECVTRACGINMKKCSRGVIFIPTDDNAVRMSCPLSYLESTAPESVDVWMTSYTDKYKSRPETQEFEEMCLQLLAGLSMVNRQRAGMLFCCAVK